MQLIKSLIFFLFMLLSLATYSKNTDVPMLDNNITLLNEITRVGETEKWNGSLFFEGPLKIRVLKDGTITDTGSFTLSKKKFGYPAIIKVINLDNKQKKYTFIFSPSSQPLFKKPFIVNVKLLQENNYFYSRTEVVNSDSSLYSSPYSPSVLYNHIFKNSNKNKISYNFYSSSKQLDEDLDYVRLVVYFNED